MEISRTLFNKNGQRLEFLPVCLKSTYDKWKNGEFIFFICEHAFASWKLDEERVEHIPEYMAAVSNWDEEKAEEFKSEWASYSDEQKQEWYLKYITEVRNAHTYEAFRKREDVFHMEETFEIYGKECVLFYLPKPKTPIGMEI